MTAMTLDTPLRPSAHTPARATAPRAAATRATRAAVPTRSALPGDATPFTGPARRAPRAARPVRLTRRGRALLLLVLVTLLLGAFSLGRTSADAGGGATAPRPTTVVQPGDTLWSIARRVAPGADPRVTVDRLARLNDLGGRPIVAGQRLVLPR
jgi:Tfp pilus assembly protein FimV